MHAVDAMIRYWCSNKTHVGALLLRYVSVLTEGKEEGMHSSSLLS